jgi:hypothetical protein
MSWKNYKNEFKSSLGGRRQKPIGALNSARNEEEAKPSKKINFIHTQN